jgi:hypothetical protein
MSTKIALTACSILAIAAAAACHHAAPSSGPTPSGPSGPRQTEKISDGESLIRAMHDRYAGLWYHTATFQQRTTIYRGETPIVQTWYESMMLPGRLRIDVGSPSAGNGTLFRQDSTYFMSGGRIASADTGFNDLLVLGFDVYMQPPEQTISILRHLGFQLSRIHSDDFGGKAVYVVGATSRYDTTSKQFWVERDRLLFVKTQSTNSNRQTNAVLFLDYVPAGKTWMARQVWQYIGVTPRVHEEYSDIKTDVDLDPGLFDSRTWSTARHWVR